MVNRKGFVRVIELLIAVTIISIILILSYKQSAPRQNTPDLGEVARDILAEVSSIENLRAEVITYQTNTTSMIKTIDFINQTLPDYILFELRSCDLSSACGQSAYRGNVFSAERIISTGTNTFDPIKLRLFLWVREN